MIEKGVVSEVKKYIKLKVPKDKSANKAIGINEVSKYIEKKIKIEEVIENISIKTRQYAKRQTTWGRGNPDQRQDPNKPRLADRLWTRSWRGRRQGRAGRRR